jgi:cytochrome c-type biogenesis protein CcmH/NrfG
MTLDISAYQTELQSKLLDDLLDLIEVDLSHIGQSNPENAQKILLKMDVAYRKIQTMTRAGISVTGPATQLEYLAVSLERNARTFLRDIGGSECLQALRAVQSPESEQRWYFLDTTYHQQIRRRLRTVGISVGIIAIVLAILIGIYQRFLAPDPVVSAKYSHQVNAEQFLTQSKPDLALLEINQALALGSEDPDLIVLRGVTEDVLGQTALSTADFALAEAKIGDREAFLLMRAETWMRANLLDKGLQDATEVIRNNPSSAQGFFYVGRANELLKNYTTAIAAYEHASQLAEAQGKIELNATVRVMLAMLIQSVPPQFGPTPQLTPGAP